MIILGLAFVYLGLTITGMYYLISGNTYSEIFQGELKSVQVYSKIDCDTKCDSNGKNCHTNCDDTFYIDEIFLKRPDGNSTSTCTVRRLTPYYFKGDADNFASRAKLGTRRTIYETTYSHGTCYDKKIRRTYNILGSLLFAFPNFVLLLVICYIGVNYFRENIEVKLITKHKEVEFNIV